MLESSWKEMFLEKTPSAALLAQIGPCFPLSFFARSAVLNPGKDSDTGKGEGLANERSVRIVSANNFFTAFLFPGGPPFMIIQENHRTKARGEIPRGRKKILLSPLIFFPSPADKPVLRK